MVSDLGFKSAVVTRIGPNFLQTPRHSLRRLLDGEDRTQLEIECEASGLRFLLYALFHPSRWFEPSETPRAYKEDGRLF